MRENRDNNVNRGETAPESIETARKKIITKLVQTDTPHPVQKEELITRLSCSRCHVETLNKQKTF